jgi:hypothetical protein
MKDGIPRLLRLRTGGAWLYLVADYITKRESTWQHAILELPASSDVDDDRFRRITGQMRHEHHC